MVSRPTLGFDRVGRTAAAIFVALGAMLLGYTPRLAHGATPRSDPRSVFFIAKSENRNQVHYGVRLDPSCAPVGPSPVFAYWRMLERGPLATEPLLTRELGAYGFAGQRVIAREPNGGQVEVTLRALPARPIVVGSGLGATQRPGEPCSATATTTIAGAAASLTSVYAKLAWPFGVEYLMLSGRSLADGRELRERIRP